LIGAVNGLIFLTLAGLVLLFYPFAQTELSFQWQKVSQKQTPVVRVHFGDLLNLTSEVSLAAEGGNSSTSQVSEGVPDPGFSIVIPKIEAKAEVVPNVDFTNQTAYSEALKAGVAHAYGSSFPGEGETIWFFAHSTDSPWHIEKYNAVFYLLRKLEPKDQIIVFFNGKRFIYQVDKKMVIEPSDVSFLEDVGEERLILQTCWPPGTTLKRLIVIAKPLF